MNAACAAFIEDEVAGLKLGALFRLVQAI